MASLTLIAGVALLTLAAPFELTEPLLRLPRQSVSSLEMALLLAFAGWGAALVFSGLVTKLRLKPRSDDERSVRESSLLGGRCAAAKTASKASPEKTRFISPEHGFRRCLGACSHFSDTLLEWRTPLTPPWIALLLAMLVA